MFLSSEFLRFGSLVKSMVFLKSISTPRLPQIRLYHGVPHQTAIPYAMSLMDYPLEAVTQVGIIVNVQIVSLSISSLHVKTEN